MASGACGSCGAADQACCGTAYGPQWCTASNTTCVYNGSFGCKPCGGRGQPCCSGITYGPMGIFGIGSCTAPLSCNYNGPTPTCGDAPPMGTPGYPYPVPAPYPGP
jgi:hypothetical protein